MALIQCPDCKNDMSTRAYFCPNCGRLTKFGYPAFITLGVVCGLLAIAAIKFLFLELVTG